MPDHWQPVTAGRGVVAQTDTGGYRLTLPASAERRYHNAQLWDYVSRESGRLRLHFDHHAPLRMSLTAYASRPAQELVGTAGFGFWNHPFSPDMLKLPRLPRAVWFFFAAPPSDMALAQGVAGHGWKAATIDAHNPRAFALMPFALPAALLMRRPKWYDRLFPPIQRALNIAEMPLDPDLLNERHTYALEWRDNGSAFYVDNQRVFETPFTPHGGLGLITWMDNRWAVVTPQGRLGAGVSEVRQEQALIIEQVEITNDVRAT